jgi:hypothetical protein
MMAYGSEYSRRNIILLYMSIAGLELWNLHKTRGSQTWQNFLKSIHLLLHWMVWSLGDGTAIIIGKDRILEMGDAALLSEELTATLNRKGLFYLFQAQKTTQRGDDQHELAHQ